MRKKSAFRIMYIIFAIVILIIFVGALTAYNVIPGNWNTVANHLINGIPYFIAIGLGFYWFVNRTTKRTSLLGDIMVCGTIGIGFAGLSNYLYLNNIWLDAYITVTNTIEEFMAVVIIIWMIIGFIIGAVKR